MYVCILPSLVRGTFGESYRTTHVKIGTLSNTECSSMNPNGRRHSYLTLSHMINRNLDAQ